MIESMKTFTKARLTTAYGAVKSTVVEKRKREPGTFVERSFTLGKAMRVQEMTPQAYNEYVLLKSMEGVVVTSATKETEEKTVVVDNDPAQYEGIFDYSSDVKRMGT